MPELDTIRGVAILAVFFFHGLNLARDLSPYPPWQRHFLTLMAAGKFGVNLFFVLSGFLITGILLESRNRQDYYKKFYFHRALRILPAYYFTLLLLILFGLTSRGFLLMSLAYSSNLSPLLGFALSYPVLWSLAVEEHFYLIWPTAVRRISSTTLFSVLGTILVLGPIFRLLHHLHAVATNAWVAGFEHYTWNNLDGLALGAIVAILARRPGWDRRQMSRLSTVLIMSAIIILVAGYPYGILTRWTAVGEALQQVPWNLGFASMLGFSLLIGSGRWRRLAAPPFMVFFGKISYGLYLYHLMVFSGFEWFARQKKFTFPLNLSPWEQAWLRLVVVGTVSVVFAYLSRRYFEEPFLRLKNRVPGWLSEVGTNRERKKAVGEDWVSATVNGESSERLPGE